MHLPQRPRARARRALLCASAVLLAACGDDGKGGTGSGTGGDGARFAASGLVLALEDETPLARVTVSAPDGTSTTTDLRGRYTLSVRESDPIGLSASGLAPVTKRAVRGPSVARMKAFDATAVIAPRSGGLVRSERLHAAARLPAGALAGDADAEVVLAAIDPRRRANLSAITGDYTARRGTATGRVSIASPLYVSTVDPRRATLSAGAQVELEFPAWVPGAEQRATLFAYEQDSADWVEIGSISAGLNDRGDEVYRAQTARLGWLAVGEFVDALVCVRGCANDARAQPVASARVTATGIDDFSEVVGATDARGCFELRVRANARLGLEVATDANVVHQQTVQTSAGPDCQDLGAVGPMESQVPQGSPIPAVVERMIGCGYGGRGGLTRALEAELSFVHERADGFVVPAAIAQRYEGYYARYLACLLETPCAELVSLFCDEGEDDDTLRPIFEACVAPIEQESTAYEETQRFRCLDGTTLGDADQTCDGETDCQDGSDETASACLATQHFACGVTVGPRAWRCDGEPQCADGADEANCFVCDDGEVLRPGYRCDGWSYCGDGSDEQRCVDGIVCPLGTAVGSATSAPFGRD